MRSEKGQYRQSPRDAILGLRGLVAEGRLFEG